MLNPILAMNLLETECSKKPNFTPLFYYRYVDDIITCIPKMKVNRMVNTFNNYHKRLKFTYETQNSDDYSIPFLDLLIINNSKKLEFNWFQKSTYYHRVLDFHSHHLIPHKHAIVTHLVDRIINLPDSCFHTENINSIQKNNQTNSNFY